MDTQTKCLNWVDWTDKLPTDPEKQAIEDILVEYNVSSPNTELVQNLLTPRYDKVVYNQALKSHSTWWKT